MSVSLSVKEIEKECERLISLTKETEDTVEVYELKKELRDALTNMFNEYSKELDFNVLAAARKKEVVEEYAIRLELLLEGRDSISKERQSFRREVMNLRQRYDIAYNKVMSKIKLDTNVLPILVGLKQLNLLEDEVRHLLFQADTNFRDTLQFVEEVLKR